MSGITRYTGEGPKSAPRITGQPKQHAKPTRAEHYEQVLFFKRVDLDPRTKHLLIYAVPNAGGFSGTFKENVVRVMKLKREGVRKGLPDVNIDEPRNGRPGCRLEFKKNDVNSRGNQREKPTPEQFLWHEALRQRLYIVEVVYSADEAWAVLMRYLGYAAGS